MWLSLCIVLIFPPSPSLSAVTKQTLLHLRQFDCNRLPLLFLSAIRLLCVCMVILGIQTAVAIVTHQATCCALISAPRTALSLFPSHLTLPSYSTTLKHAVRSRDPSARSRGEKHVWRVPYWSVFELIGGFVYSNSCCCRSSQLSWQQLGSLEGQRGWARELEGRQFECGRRGNEWENPSCINKEAGHNRKPERGSVEGLQFWNEDKLHVWGGLSRRSVISPHKWSIKCN